jgi:tetrahydromethanopterin S-methyltransferase subunit E
MLDRINNIAERIWCIVIGIVVIAILFIINNVIKQKKKERGDQ